MNKDDIIYVIDQTRIYNPNVPKYAFYDTPFKASLHGTIGGFTPYETSRRLPQGVQGIDFVIYDHSLFR